MLSKRLKIAGQTQLTALLHSLSNYLLRVLILNMCKEKEQTKCKFKVKVKGKDHT